MKKTLNTIMLAILNPIADFILWTWRRLERERATHVEELPREWPAKPRWMSDDEYDRIVGRWRRG